MYREGDYINVNQNEYIATVMYMYLVFSILVGCVHDYHIASCGLATGREKNIQNLVAKLITTRLLNTSTTNYPIVYRRPNDKFDVNQG